MKTETAPIKKPVKVTEFLRYEFTQDELTAISKDLALSVQKKTRTTEEQKAAQAQFKQRIEHEQAIIGRLSTNINMGWEMRNIDCEVRFHIPTHAVKQIVRLDTGEIVREQPMNASELQENLFEE